jgi:hypothetical protein
MKRENEEQMNRGRGTEGPEDPAEQWRPGGLAAPGGHAARAAGTDGPARGLAGTGGLGGRPGKADEAGLPYGSAFGETELGRRAREGAASPCSYQPLPLTASNNNPPLSPSIR